MDNKYRVSVNGMTLFYETEEEAMKAAKTFDETCLEARVVVYNPFNNVVFEN